ncbi:unnamed protein product, partial [Choristocarpus tenellus]
QVVLFLDYDGTLSPIVEQPDRAFMSDGMRSVLGQVVKCTSVSDDPCTKVYKGYRRVYVESSPTSGTLTNHGAVAERFTTAIVTGRSKQKVYNFVKLDGVFYAGSHGLEIQGPQATPVTCQVLEKN